MVRLSAFLLTMSVASAARLPVLRQDALSSRKLLVGAPGQILSYTYDGTNFQSTATLALSGTAPSWMIYKQPNLLYAVDENSESTRLLSYDPDTGAVAAKSAANGSAGVVSLEFNKNQTYMVGGSYSLGQLDIWDISAADGSLNLVKQVALTGPVNSEGVHRAHQVVLDPTGQFFAIADLGGDAIHFLDASTFEIVSSGSVEPSDAGPRHGAFIGGNCTTFPTHYVVACEKKSLINLYEVSKTADGKVNLTSVQSLSTYGDAFPPADPSTAAAGELVLSSNQKDIYVSNRLSGNETDSISHFQFQDGKIAFVDQISSGGLTPRMFSLSPDEDILFSSNQGGNSGLVAFKRNNETGSLESQATMSNSLVSTTSGSGPQFVRQIE